eukprot:TRINITY_DN73021_c0_g1_i1.p1 TRINITY_DN73021_c0_g1~~TRINITY_DN73021_c0_g1_i1.p1  ORF type:complete len:496 (+),score=55.36 TRINITY_DN73021_c0_g1_i1:67-1554(+)
MQRVEVEVELLLSPSVVHVLSLPAQVAVAELREFVADIALDEISENDCRMKSPGVLDTSQIRLFLDHLGAGLELDYSSSISLYTGERIFARILREDWQDVINSLPHNKNAFMIKALKQMSNFPIDGSPDGTWGSSGSWGSFVSLFAELFRRSPPTSLRSVQLRLHNEDTASTTDGTDSWLDVSGRSVAASDGSVDGSETADEVWARGIETLIQRATLERNHVVNQIEEDAALDDLEPGCLSDSESEVSEGDDACIGFAVDQEEPITMSYDRCLPAAYSDVVDDIFHADDAGPRPDFQEAQCVVKALEDSVVKVLEESGLEGLRNLDTERVITSDDVIVLFFDKYSKAFDTVLTRWAASNLDRVCDCDDRSIRPSWALGAAVLVNQLHPGCADEFRAHLGGPVGKQYVIVERANVISVLRSVKTIARKDSPDLKGVGGIGVPSVDDAKPTVWLHEIWIGSDIDEVIEVKNTFLHVDIDETRSCMSVSSAPGRIQAN